MKDIEKKIIDHVKKVGVYNNRVVVLRKES